jgi:branched-chain amino acid transport system ATP-binding protein
LLLKLNSITVHYDTAEAVKEVTLEMEEGHVLSIIGANGAGKSTILAAICGRVPLTSGEIWFNDKRINGMATHNIAKLGLTQIPEGGGLFPYISVMGNLMLGAYLRKDKAEINRDLDKIFEYFPFLKKRRNQKAGTLSGGEQQMLSIGRALMTKPKLLLMDEPSLGLSPLIIKNLANVILEINKSGISILLVEQNASLVMKVADRGYVLEVGKIVLEGNLKELMNNKLVQRAFLG